VIREKEVVSVRRVKLIFAVLALLVAMVASSAPAMAQPTDGPWDDDYWYPGSGYGPYSDPEDYEEAYDEFEDNCTGFVSDDECWGLGEDWIIT